jgi:hypothetical protein
VLLTVRGARPYLKIKAQLNWFTCRACGIFTGHFGNGSRGDPNSQVKRLEMQVTPASENSKIFILAGDCEHIERNRS